MMMLETLNVDIDALDSSDDDPQIMSESVPLSQELPQDGQSLGHDISSRLAPFSSNKSSQEGNATRKQSSHFMAWIQDCVLQMEVSIESESMSKVDDDQDED